MDPDILFLDQNDLSGADNSYLLSLLSAEEQNALQKVRDDSKRMLKLYTHGRLHMEAAARLHVRPEDLLYQTGEHGKPFFANGSGLHFSLSYTRDAAVLAFASHPIGIDIEKIRPHHMRLGKNLGTPHELSVLRDAPNDLTLFYTFWTRKEAWLKLTGTGLTVPLTSFDVWDEPATSRLFTFRKEDYCISVCM